MNRALGNLLLLLTILLTACGGPTATVAHRPTPTAPPPTPTATVPPPGSSPETTAAAFLAAWESGDYATMYSLVSPADRAALDQDGFAERYRAALTTATVLTVTTRLQSALRTGDQATVSYHLTLATALVGTLETDIAMPLTRYAGRWLVDWSPALIWPALGEENYFRMEYRIPTRANIYDRNGLALATQGTVVTVGVIPGQIEDETALLDALTQVTGLTPEEIRGRYVAAPADWKIPIADIPSEVSVRYNDLLSAVPGIYREEKESRTYPGDGEYGVAPHIVGWVSPVPAEHLDYYRARGYRGDEWVGISGLEAWGEEILAGRHGGRLTVVTPAGEEVAEVAESPSSPSRNIYTTVDREFQAQVQTILGGRRGAIVVLAADSGAILALASGPGFDPNVFVAAAGDVGRAQVLADPRNPLFNRATLGTYPSASVFKIVTMAAAMEEGGMNPDRTFYCPGYWEGLGPDFRKKCWKEDGHGEISLKDGLTASCDVTFYTVGQALDGLDPNLLPRFGRDFGFGEPTGLVGLPEEGGLVPDPAWKEGVLGEPWWAGDTINLAIGQGYLLVTPLQVARMIAAVANGGTLYRPYLVEKVGTEAEGVETVAGPEAVGQLPLTPEHLAVIQEALLGVTTKPLGTAHHRFIGMSIPVAGKTGTAEVGGPDTEPHAWFAGYAPANAPEIAVAVIVENGGEGSAAAAPLMRQVVEAYYGLPLSPLPPEAQEGYVPPTPEP